MKSADELALLFDEVIARAASGRVIILASPDNPDADSCASMIAFREFLKWMHRETSLAGSCHLYAPEAPRKNTLYETMGKLCDPCSQIKQSLPAGANLCILFDYGDFRRAKLDDAEKAGAFFIGFDHHPEGKFPKNGIQVVDSGAPSTTALLWRFFQHAGYPVGADVATCLLAGLTADTGKFSNSSANPDAFEIASELMRQGARYQDILRAMHHPITAANFRAQSRARTEWVNIDEKTGLAFLWFSEEDLAGAGAEREDVFPLLKTLQHLAEVKVAAAYYETPGGEWYCSLRSNPAGGLSVRPIAEMMGGGGHEKAAAFRSRKRPEQVLAALTSAMRKIS